MAEEAAKAAFEVTEKMVAAVARVLKRDAEGKLKPPSDTYTALARRLLDAARYEKTVSKVDL